MTVQEAIETIKYASAFNRDDSPLTVALDMAIKEMEQKDNDCIIKHLTKECSYNETGCSGCKGIEKIKEALEKQIKLEEVVARLEEEKGIAFLTLANTGDSKYDLVYDNVMAYINKAIEIIKEEVG